MPGQRTFILHEVFLCPFLYVFSCAIDKGEELDAEKNAVI
ncbi:Hypothetical protein ACI5QM_02463 [Bacillus subtilis]